MHDQRAQANAVTYGCMIDACVKCNILNGVIIGTKPNKKNAFEGPHFDSQFTRDFA